MAKKLVIIGNGIATEHFLRTFHQEDKHAWEVTIIEAEPAPRYDRVLLSSLITGQKTLPDLIFEAVTPPDHHEVATFCGEHVVRIDRQARLVHTENGRVLHYDTLILATGSEANRIPVTGADADHVLVHRNLTDTARIIRLARSSSSAIVIGGGLLGLELSAALADEKFKVTVLQGAPFVMERQLDKEAGSLLVRQLAKLGVEVRTGTNITGITQVGKDTSRVLIGETGVLDADFVVIAAGTRPAVDLALGCGLSTKRGVVVDLHMRTSDPHILAIGECAELEGRTFGLVKPVSEMARIGARTIAQTPGPCAVRTGHTLLKIAGINVFSCGDVAEAEDVESVVVSDPARMLYRSLFFRKNRLIGAICLGAPEDNGFFAVLISEGSDISAIRDQLIFGLRWVPDLKPVPTPAPAPIRSRPPRATSGASPVVVPLRAKRVLQ